MLFVFILPTLIFAQSPTNPGGTTGTTQNPVTIGATIKNPFNGGNDLMTLIRTILSDIVMPIAAIAVVMWIIWAGFQFVLAQGNPGAIDKAKQNLLYSLIGGGILLGAVAISKVIQATVTALIAQ